MLQSALLLQAHQAVAAVSGAPFSVAVARPSREAAGCKLGVDVWMC